MNLKNWPNNWSNRIGIIGIPFAIKISGSWFVKVYYLDLNQKNLECKSYLLPMEAAPYLSMGAAIETNFEKKEQSGYIRNIYIENLENGKIVSLNSLNKTIYKFEIPEELYNDCYFYKIDILGETYLFFCFEFLRRLYLNPSFLVPYIMNPQEMSLLIDNYEIQENYSGKKNLTIYFNKEVNAKILTPKFIQTFTLINFHPQLKNLWNNILKAQAHPEEKNHFHFLPSFLENLNLTCRIKKINDINLVYEINSISGIKMPFDNVDAAHPKFIEKNVDISKEQYIPKEDSQSNIVDYKETGYNPSKSPKTAYADNFSFDLGNEFSIKKIKKTSDGSKQQSKKLPITQMVNEEHFALNTPLNESDKAMLNIESLAVKQVINYDEIPNGLVAFAKSISIVATILQTGLNYTLLDLPGTSKYTYIEQSNQEKRKLMMARLNLTPAVSILEIDSSDGRSLSTLVLKSENDVELSQIASGITEGGYSWPLEILKKMQIDFQRLKHPYIYTDKKFDSEDDKAKYKIYKHADNIRNIIKTMG